MIIIVNPAIIWLMIAITILSTLVEIVLLAYMHHQANFYDKRITELIDQLSRH